MDTWHFLTSIISRQILYDETIFIFDSFTSHYIHSVYFFSNVITSHVLENKALICMQISSLDLQISFSS